MWAAMRYLVGLGLLVWMLATVMLASVPAQAQEARVNFALEPGVMASQSSLWTGTADRAIDNDRGTASSAGSERQPWWEVDLGSVRYIDEIRLSMNPFVIDQPYSVLVSDIPFAGNSLDDAWATPGVFDRGFDTRFGTVVIPVSRTGRYVRIQHERLGVLTLNEVEVIGRRNGTVDPTITSIVRQRPAAEVTNADILIWRVTFSEPVLNVVPDAFRVDGTTARVTSVVRVDATNSYDITVSGGDLAGRNGAVGLLFAGSHNITDDFGNELVTRLTSSSGPSNLTYTLDNQPPVVAVGEIRRLPSGIRRWAFTISVTEANDLDPASVIEASDLDLSGNTTDVAVSGAGTTYTGSFRATDNAALFVGLRAGAVRDLAGNESAALPQAHIPEDLAAVLAVDITGTPPATQGRRPFTVTYTFSGNVGTSFDIDGARAGLGNATASNFRTVTAGTVFTAEITPDGRGDVTLDVPAGVAQGTGGNGGNRAAPQVVVRYVPVGVTVSPEALSVFEAGGEATYTVVLDTQPSGDVTVTPSSSDADAAMVSGPLIFSSANWNVAQTVTVTGVDADLNSPGDLRALAVTHTVAGGDYDGVSTDPVTVTVVDAAPQFTSAASVSTPENTVATGYRAQASAVFGTVRYAITGGADPDLFVINANTGVVTFRAAPDFENPGDADGGNVYRFTVTATAASEQYIETATQDVDVTVRDVDEVSPTMSLRLSGAQTGDPLGTAYNVPFRIRFAFSEAVSGFDRATVNSALTNATVRTLEASGNLPDGRQTYEALIAPQDQGAVRFDFAASDIGANVRDAAGNPVVSADPASVVLAVYDTEGPSVALSGQPDVVNSRDPFDVTVIFSEPVSGFDIGGLSVAPGETGNLRGSGTTYTVTITPDGTRDVYIGVMAGAATDAAGNASTASEPVSVVFDAQRPTATISAPDHVRGPFEATVTFSEPVTLVDGSDFAVDGGTASNLTASGSGDAYAVTITPMQDLSSNTAIMLDVPQGTAEDSAGNANIASPQVTVVYDTEAPVVTVPEDISVISEDGQPVVVTYDAPTATDDVGVAGSLRLTSGLASGAAFPLGVTTVTWEASDAAGNVGTGSFDVHVDGEPTVEIEGVPVNASQTSQGFDITVRFSQPVTGFGDDPSDIIVVNGRAIEVDWANFEGTVYRARIVPFSAFGESTEGISVQIPAGAAHNQAGAPNKESAPRGTQLDDLPPRVRISNVPAEAATADIFDLTVVFSEPVTGFGDDPSDIIVTDGSAAVTGQGPGGIRYTIRVSFHPGSGALRTIQIPEGAAQDHAGNGNLVSEHAITSARDVAAPELVSIIRLSPDSSPTNADTLIWRFSFREEIQLGPLILPRIAESFEILGTTAQISVTTVPDSDRSFDVSVSGGDLAGANGLVTLVPGQEISVWNQNQSFGWDGIIPDDEPNFTTSTISAPMWPLPVRQRR